MTPTQAVVELPLMIRVAKDIADELTYRSYASNRRRSPWIAPERWARVYENAAEMERRYQQEGGR